MLSLYSVSWLYQISCRFPFVQCLGTIVFLSPSLETHTTIKFVRDVIDLGHIAAARDLDKPGSSLSCFVTFPLDYKNYIEDILCTTKRIQNEK